MGFCVAITMNGVPSVCVSVSTVTCRSSMHSRSADWVFGEARLISSPSTMLAKIAPGLNSKSPVSWLNTLTPVTSVGSRSGVNWIRRNEQSIDRAESSRERTWIRDLLSYLHQLSTPDLDSRCTILRPGRYVGCSGDKTSVGDGKFPTHDAHRSGGGGPTSERTPRAAPFATIQASCAGRPAS